MDLIAIGEILIDLTQTGISPAGIPQFSANPGGAPAYLAVAVSRLDASTAFIGKVGDDSFGAFLRKTLLDNGVDVSAMAVDPAKRTTMAVVSVDERGERSFCFYRDRTADVMLTADDVPQELLAKTKLVHFGSVSLVAEPARSATIETAKRAKAMEPGADAAFEPGARLPRKVDAVIESVGAATWGHSVRSVRPGGTIAICGATTGDQPGAELTRVFFQDIRVQGNTMGSREDFARLLRFVEHADLHPMIDAAYPMAEAPAAFARMAAGDVFGKLVLRV